MSGAVAFTVDRSVPLPAGGVNADDWQPDALPWRVVLGADRGVEGMSGVVRTSAIQFADGAVDDGSRIEAPAVHVSVDVGEALTAEQARRLVELLTAAADEIERMLPT